jgi:outer membrane protein assembly factor BamE (lipoprotein component of BamABCDE complex)
MKNLLNVAFIAAMTALSGCAAKTGHGFLEEMSQEEISKDLIISQTTKAQVKEKFGDPSEVDFDMEGKEKWVYLFTRAEAKGVNFVPLVSAFYRGTNDTIKRLTIIFDTSGKVLRHAFSNSQQETHMGAFQ